MRPAGEREDEFVTLMTAHRILIGSVVVFFAFFAGWVAWHAPAWPGRSTSWSLGSTAAAVGLAIYLARVWRRI